MTGDPNGPVKVKIVVEASASNPALPFEEKEGKWSGNYIITSETINIPADEKTANVEISTVDDLEENPIGLSPSGLNRLKARQSEAPPPLS